MFLTSEGLVKLSRVQVALLTGLLVILVFQLLVLYGFPDDDWPWNRHSVVINQCSITSVAQNQNEEQIVFLGKIEASRSYVVFSSVVGADRESQFLLPLTTLSWRRAGFHSIVIVVADRNLWLSDALLTHIVERLCELEAVIVFIQPLNLTTAVVLSQVSRIFVTNVLRSHEQSGIGVIDNVYILTSDVDIWPIRDDIYRKSADRDILSISSYCCGSFSHRNATYRQLPVYNIGMTIDTWHSLVTRSGRTQPPRSPEEMLRYVVDEFGRAALSSPINDEERGSNLDQRLVSVLVDDWVNLTTAIRMDPIRAPIARSMAIYRRTRVEFVVRYFGRDRINLRRSTTRLNIADKVDALVRLDLHRPEIWSQMQPLFREMYGNSDRMAWIKRYYDDFSQLLTKVA